jgi:hypothetical protein
MAKKAPTSSASPRSRAAREPETLGAPPAPAAPAEPFPTLGSVLGQERAIATLRSAVRSGRVHHAWIFHGPQGVGKFTTALAFAGLLLDAAPGGPEPDGTSPAGQMLRRRAHPDLHIVRKELALVSREPSVRDRKQISIPRDVVEEFLIEPAQRTRVVQGDTLAHKVFIVDQADLLNHHSQTILLKTIEEPPPGTVILLVSSSEHELAATIRSRCQRVGFAPLSDEAMRAWLERAGAGVPEAQRRWMMGFAGNAPGVLRAALDAGLAAWHERLTPMLDAAASGRYSHELGPAMAALVDEHASAWVEARENASKEAATRAGAAWMFRLVGAWLGGMLVDAATSGGSAGPRGVLAAIDALARAEHHLDRNLQAQFVFEWLSAELAAAFAGSAPARA